MLLGARILPASPLSRGGTSAGQLSGGHRGDTWGRRGLVSRPCPASPEGEVFTRARPLRASFSGAGIGTGVRGSVQLGSEALLCFYLRNGSSWRRAVAAALLVETGQGESELDPRQGLGSGSRLNQDEVAGAADRRLGSTRCSCRPLLGSGSAPSAAPEASPIPRTPGAAPSCSPRPTHPLLAGGNPQGGHQEAPSPHFGRAGAVSCLSRHRGTSDIPLLPPPWGHVVFFVAQPCWLSSPSGES